MDRVIPQILVVMTLIFMEGRLAFDPTTVCSVNSSLEGLEPPACASCDMRCGRAVDLDNQGSCSCDPQCIMYGDCCHDFHQSCPAEATEAGNQTNFPGDKPTCEQLEVNKGMDWKYKYLVISTCQGQIEPCRRSNDSPYDYLPIVDAKTGLNYVNIKCAICNNASVTDLKPWSATGNCRKPEISVGRKKVLLRHINSELLLNESVKHPLKTAKCRLDILPPRRITTPRRCVKKEKLVKDCPKSCSNRELRQGCEQGHTNYFMSRSKIYKNYHCVMCHQAFRAARCVNTDPRATDGDPWIKRHSMPILFDFDPRDGLLVGRRKAVTPKCPPSYKWVEYQCRRVFQKTTPNPFKTNMKNGNQRVQSLTARNTSFNQTMEIYTFRNFLDDIYKNISHFMKKNNIQAQIQFHADVAENNVNMSVLITQKPGGIFSNLSHVKFSVKQRVDNIYSSYDFDRTFYINVSIFVNEHPSTYLQEHCSYVKYDESEFQILNNDTLIINERIFNSSSWFTFNGSSWICTSPSPLNHIGVSWGLGLTTLCLLTLSAAALTIRILLHLVLPELQNAAGRVQTCLALAMLIAILCLLIAPVLPPRTTICHIGGLVSHWALLAMFSWMTAVSLDIWRMVWLSSRFYKVYHRKGTFLKFSLFAWVTPTMIVGASETLNLLSPDSRFRPQYGIDLCWINQR